MFKRSFGVVTKSSNPFFGLICMRILRKPVTVSDGNQRNEMTVGVNCLFDWVGPNQTLRNGSKGHPSELMEFTVVLVP